jgi:Protein of unknown function (DUF3037)
MHDAPDTAPAGTATDTFQYAIVRVVPRVERGECFNAGIVLFARTREYLAARTALDRDLLARLAPTLDPEVVQAHLAAVERIAAGDADAGAIARLSQSERFHWLVAPSSTVVQPSPSHMGLCSDPAGTLDRLFDRLVARLQ